MPKYIVRQQGQNDEEFDESTRAVQYLVANRGFMELLVEDGGAIELLMTKGDPSCAPGACD